MAQVTSRIGSPLWTALTALGEGIALESEAGAPAGVEAVERGLAVLRESGAPNDAESGLLSLLARARLAAGDLAGARAATGEALAWAERKQNREDWIVASLVRARVLLGTGEIAPRDEAAELLDEIDRAIAETGTRVYAPPLCEVRADLAAASGDAPGRVRALGEALRHYTDMKATGHARRVAAELEREGTR
jgi:ATP/maltotriose-dependent transcriptional regulator MalT